ncbi:hypothetical protein ACFS27_19750 [Promicromonospora vindobonensis]|uniref:EfeO-type cupredoxin-like domain-containing protein n=1 Tax=Promicromonospora vindobonensis TaxID=195748 RepID=A0ABW5VZQ6_9MICO
MRRTARALPAALLTVVLAAGCTTSGDGAPDPGVSGVVTSTLRVGLTEWSIETGGAVPAAGELTVLVTNTGGTGHDLVVHGERGTWQTPVLAAGERHELTVTAVPGETLELICSVTGHHAAGMSADLDVAEDP